MDVKLKVVAGVNSGQEICLAKDKFFIGRAEDCQLRPNSDLISRHHCVFLVDGSYVGLRDCGSKNGTFLNGDRITGECELKAGDLVIVGPLEFEVLCEHRVGGKPKPAVADVADVAARTVAARTGAARTGAAGTGAAVNDHGEDISDWLEKSPDGAAATQETRSWRSDETREFEITPQLEPEPAVQSDSSNAESVGADSSNAELKKKDKPKGKPGKLPPARAAAAKDSRGAALDVLKNMTRRR